jgi:predicted HD superfamily hydrolase involved in NAD metabolism
MWSEEQIKEYLNEKLKKNRYEHSLSVQDTAIKLAEFYHGNVKKASTAGLVHDCAKHMSNDEMLSMAHENQVPIDEVSALNPQLLHGNIAAVIAKNVMGIYDEEILSAVACHTTGKKDMNLLEKIVYIADYIEPLRNFPGVEILREEAFTNLDTALLDAFNNTIKVVIDRGQLLHVNTISGRNYLVFKKAHK